MTRQRQTVGSNYATPWKPEGEGETIEGIYSGYNVVRGDRNESFKSHKVKPEGKEEYIGVSGALIDGMLLRVPAGTYVWITYKGLIKTKNGQAKDYNVECEKGTKLLELQSEHDDGIPE